MVLPYSPSLDARHGGRTVAQLLIRLGQAYRVGIVHLRRPDEEPACKAVRERCELVEEIQVPDPADPARRWRRGAKLLIGLTAAGRPVQATDFASRDGAARLREVARRWNPDVVHVELEAMAQYLPALADVPARNLLVLVEPAAQTADERWHSSHGLERLTAWLDRRAWRRFERRIAGDADAMVVLTERDRAAAMPIAAGAPIQTIPLGAELPPKPLDPIGTPPPSILFFGGFGHPPNVDAALTMASRIFPAVVEHRPETRLYLVGDKPPPKIRALADEHVVVTGPVPDVSDYLNRAAVVVAPLRIGGGMRLKVMEALAAGKALVATPRAVAGLALVDGRHAVIAESEEMFAQAILRVLDDPDERRRLAETARAWAETHLDLAVSVARYERLYDELSAGVRS